VECVADADCGALTCNETLGVCTAACQNDAMCTAGDIDQCDMNGGFCVECLNNNDCPGGDVCHPDSGVCGECADDADCGGNRVCDPTTAQCVECRDRTQCDNDEYCGINGECREL
jgi:Cys-rich repeat protein